MYTDRMCSTTLIWTNWIILRMKLPYISVFVSITKIEMAPPPIIDKKNGAIQMELLFLKKLRSGINISYYSYNNSHLQVLFHIIAEHMAISFFSIFGKLDFSPFLSMNLKKEVLHNFYSSVLQSLLEKRMKIVFVKEVIVQTIKFPEAAAAVTLKKLFFF